MSWPDDADGDMLRGLQESGFDFSRACLIDFDVDFESWPPAPEALELLCREYPSARLYPPEDDRHTGYVEFQVYAQVTYELITGVQAHVSDLMAPFKGRCCAWGVLMSPE